MLINHNINNISGGVSQQPVEHRFDNQVEAMINYQITAAQGTRRRNPVKQISSTTTAHGENMKTHSYDRGDGLAKYILNIDSGNLRIIDELGGEKTVNIVGTNPISAWTGINWKKDLKLLTVGDTTWILNTKQIVSSTTIPAGAVVHKAFVWIKRSFDNGSSAGYDYEVTLDGVLYTTNATTTLTAANNLQTDIAAAGYTTKRSGSILRITRGTAFTFESGDSWGDQASTGWTESIAKIEDLPADMDGFTEEEVGIVAITGTDNDNFTNYYLKWNTDHWTETVKDGFSTELDNETLPARLRQISDNTFEFGFHDEWEDRKKGDEDTNPEPSFVGKTIGNMFFFKNRLGFTSEENVILSETGSYYNFFATTVMEILDADPIDAAVDSNTVSIIRNINATAGALTLWADDAQFLLSGGEILSPATTRISQTSSYSSTNRLPPVVVDNEIIFFNVTGVNLEALSYSPASLQADKSSAESISSHVPVYIPETIEEVVVSSTNNLMFLKDSEDDYTLYVYKYHIRDGKKVISAWFTWEMTYAIKTITILADILYLMTDTNDVVKIDLVPYPITEEFLDKGVTPYLSDITMSSYNVEVQSGTQVIREPFYIKNIKASTEGKVDFTIINSERNSIKTINQKHINRKHIVGGNSEKINVGFRTNYDTGCQINTISVEGRVQLKSRSI
jgi:hypothetical protein